MDFAMSSLGFCNGFTWILQGFHLESCVDFAMRSLGFCNGVTWTLKVFYLEFCRDFARSSLGVCRGFNWSSAGIVQGAHVDLAVGLL